MRVSIFLCLIIGGASVRFTEEGNKTETAPCDPTKICFVSSNAPEAHGGAGSGSTSNDIPKAQRGYNALVQECLQNAKDTQVVVLSLQDYKDGLPETLGPFVQKFVVQGFQGTGFGRHCKSTLIPVIDCGGVALAVYALNDVDILHPSVDRISAKTFTKTATTVKGAVAAKLELNGQPIVLASTHGEEGVRGKKAGSHCSRGMSSKHEEKRVDDFMTSLMMVRQLSEDTLPALWGGDFNPRTVHPSGSKAGCPIWPYLDNPQASPAEMLEALTAGRDILGAWHDGTLVTFTELLSGTGMSELSTSLICPTYKKGKKKNTGEPADDDTEELDDDDEEEDADERPPPEMEEAVPPAKPARDGGGRVVLPGDDEDEDDFEEFLGGSAAMAVEAAPAAPVSGRFDNAINAIKSFTSSKKKDEKQDMKQFLCQEHEEAPEMSYKVSHPPSWTDRIFATMSTEVMGCTSAKRILHQDDHDALLVVCSLEAKCDRASSSNEPSNPGKQGPADGTIQRCCCQKANKSVCRIHTKSNLMHGWGKKSFNPFKANEYLCPTGWTHHEAADFDRTRCELQTR
eukprot:TRINITY_DN3919_c0_g1_i2.p1 TRINITY_DN3919_c0_g1~~TRINITY_DN3919_c0_g1_i2.p1  ORF type:complete len:570 (+),score=122.01 TRINITY_DN3919_c0_g1_i2:76-1785(+)